MTRRMPDADSLDDGYFRQDWWKIAGLFLLLILEVTLLTFWFDFGEIVDTKSLLSRMIHRFPTVVRLCLMAGGAMLAFSIVRLWSEHQWKLITQSRVRCWIWLTSGHVIMAAGFAVLTQLLLTSPDLGSTRAYMMAGIWVVMGCMAAVMWCLALAPLTLWGRVIMAGWPMMIVGGIAALAIWRSKIYLKEAWRPLAEGTFWLTHQLLSPFYENIINQPDQFILGTTQFHVSIARDCSGYEGAGLILVFMGLYLWLFRQRLRFPHVLILIPLGMVTIWVANAVRIAVLIAIGSSWSPKVALGGFHSQAGWLAFNLIALGIVVLTGRLSIFRKRTDDDGERQGENVTVPYLLPFLAIVATAMVTSALAAGFDILYPLRVMAGGLCLLIFWRKYEDLRLTFSFVAMGLGVLTAVIWILLLPAPDPATPTLPASLSSLPFHLAVIWGVFRCMGYALVAPLAEELAFRSYLTRRVISSDFSGVPPGQFSWLSFIVSSAAFAFMHGANWLPALIAGIVFSVALYRRRELADAVTAHATANVTLLVYALVTGQWHAVS